MASDGRGPSVARTPGGQAPVHAAEVIGAMSIATDLGTGQPLEHALRTAILAVRLGELAGLSPPELVDAYYISLLHSFGCTSDAPEQTELFGDDIGPRAKFALVDGGNPEEVGAFLMDVVGQGRPPEVRTAMVAHALKIARSTFALHCEVAQRFAGWLGFGPGVVSNLAYVFERWDGNGFPGAAAGEAIPPPARVLHVARDISVFLSAAGPERAGEVIEQRAGGAYDPHLAALATDHLDELLDGLDDALIWEQAMRERRPHRPALGADGAEAELLRDAREGRLCPEAVDAVLAAAGHRVAKRPRELPARLTDRELEVLLALAAGQTNKEIAETLGISPKTAGHHVQHILDKTGARTRTAATVWAFERHLVQSA
jgi:DNA-binding CsgD family transcriptional regulator